MESKKQNSEPSASDNINHVHENNYLVSAAATLCAVFPYGAAASFGCALAALAGLATGDAHARASTTLQGMGLAQLGQAAPAIDGAGVTVGQVEATVASGGTYYYFEPNPSINSGAVFSYVGASGQSTGSYASYNANCGSWHANDVGELFYGSGGYVGVAPGVSRVAVYAESYFSSTFPIAGNPSAGAQIPAVINQSFALTQEPASVIQSDDVLWDNSASQYNLLYVSAIGDGIGTDTVPKSYVNPPATMYNGIAVGVYNGQIAGGSYGASSGAGAYWAGPTWDGRSKPDLVAPVPALGTWTSFTAPEVSGVATLMEQAGRGTNLSGPVGLTSSDAAISAQGATAYTTAATDIRTVKALLLNGAVKPTGWTNSYTVNSGTYTYNAVNANAITPLDPRYGAGVVNAYNSYENLAGGEHNFTSTTAQSIAALPSVTSAPTANFSGLFSQAASATNPATITGWNLATIAATSTSNAVENYDFNLTGTSVNAWDLTATLTWNKNYNASGINHLMLFLLNSSGQQVASSTSMLDNVQQINVNPALGINSLAPGQYDLAVEMLGGVNAISTSDTYALAWNFVDPTNVPEPAALAIFALGLSLLAVPKKRASKSSIISIDQ